jgi:hypothetical protein
VDLYGGGLGSIIPIFTKHMWLFSRFVSFLSKFYSNLKVIFIMPILNFGVFFKNLDISSLGLRSYHLLFGIKFEEILSCTVSNESL